MKNIKVQKHGVDIDVKSLVNEVNKLDKESGLKLKKSNVFNEPDKVFEIACMNYEVLLSKLIAVLNGIDVDEYFAEDDKFGTVGGPIGINQFEFTELSNLNWLSNEMYDTKSIMFKCRFLTLTLIEYKMKLDKMSMLRFKSSGKSFGPYEHSYFYLKTLVEDAERLIATMLMDNNYGNILLKMHQNYSYTKNKFCHKKYNKTVYDAITELKDGLNSSILSERFMDDDMAIYSILRISYLVSTNDMNLSNIPGFKYISGATKHDDLIKLISALGAAILTEHKYSKRPPLYKAFNDAKPIIMTNYKEVNEDWYVSIGIRSLAYTDFLCNDKRVHKFINAMINK